MSTYMYLQCQNHLPPLTADDESGQHYYDLPQIKQDLENREQLVELAEVDMLPTEYFRKNTVKFLVQHQDCFIEIISEYGVIQ